MREEENRNDHMDEKSIDFLMSDIHQLICLQNIFSLLKMKRICIFCFHYQIKIKKTTPNTRLCSLAG